MSNAFIIVSYRENPYMLDTGPINGEMWSNIGGMYRLEVQATTPGSEVIYGFQWLTQVLGADSALSGFAPGGVWKSMVPDGTVTPYVVLTFMAGSDVLTFNAVRLMTTPLYQIKAVGPASLASQVISAAGRIDQLIGSPPTSGSI